MPKKITSYKCKLCKKIFLSYSGCWKHEKKHEDDPLFKKYKYCTYTVKGITRTEPKINKGKYKWN